MLIVGHEKVHDSEADVLRAGLRRGDVEMRSMQAYQI